MHLFRFDDTPVGEPLAPVRTLDHAVRLWHWVPRRALPGLDRRTPRHGGNAVWYDDGANRGPRPSNVAIRRRRDSGTFDDDVGRHGEVADAE
jgi:hypothetical protein